VVGVVKKAKENISLLVTAAIALALLITADHYGLPHKWQTAIFGMMVPFEAKITYLLKRYD